MGQRSSRGGLDLFKHEIAQELGLVSTNEDFKQAMDRHKYEAAHELGLLDKLQTVGWGEMTSRECGAIGGRLGGRIGGQMVKRMVQFAENQLMQ